MVSAKHFKWLPNALTILRILLAFVVCWAAANGRWTLGFWLLFIALCTDFLDGLAAKKLNATTKFGAQLDRKADAIISCGGLVGLALAGLLTWWCVVLAPLIALFVAEERFFRPKTGPLHRVRPLISIAYLFTVWTYLVWMYLSQAYGWHWWYVALTLAFIGGSALLKKHRLRAMWEANRK
jgi:phosphatidylglycerophosphate synthase